MIGIIGGTGLSGLHFINEENLQEIKTDYGITRLYIGENVALLLRHGINGEIPPHMINYKANMMSFKKKGVHEVIGVNSVGSLKKDIAPPVIIIPHDYLNIWRIVTYFDSEIIHVTPSLSESLRGRMIKFSLKEDLKFIDRGIYIQTMGPRLETKAEVEMLSKFGDVVGMTMAYEATLAKELGLEYASICSVDNFAHGIVEEELSFENIQMNARINCENVLQFLMKFVKEGK